MVSRVAWKLGCTDLKKMEALSCLVQIKHPAPTQQHSRTLDQSSQNVKAKATLQRKYYFLDRPKPV